MENFPPDKAGFFKRIKPFALSGTELINSVFPTRRSPQTKQGGKKKFHGELGPTSNNLKKVFLDLKTGVLEHFCASWPLAAAAEVG